MTCKENCLSSPRALVRRIPARFDFTPENMHCLWVHLVPLMQNLLSLVHHCCKSRRTSEKYGRNNKNSLYNHIWNYEKLSKTHLRSDKAWKVFTYCVCQFTLFHGVHPIHPPCMSPCTRGTHAYSDPALIYSQAWEQKGSMSNDPVNRNTLDDPNK